MIVKRNTYPVINGVARAEVGEVVSWHVARGQQNLVRESDGKTVFSRDCYPKDKDDYRPTSGIVGQVKCRGWILEVS